MKRLGSILCMATLISLGSLATADTFHRWVDENGVTHYSKTAPQGRQSETISTTTGTPAQQSAPMAEPAPADHHETSTSSADEVQAKWCQQHRENLDILQNKDRVQQQDPDTGEMRTLTEAERAEMIKQIEAQLEGC